jgi:eukaryotic-like serine/threonine-protein kinase
MSLGPGQRLGPYEVVGALGSGGQGEVYRARDTRLGRDVALKVLPEDLASSPERRSRLEHEAKLLASLQHPGIAALFDILEHEGSPVLVMEVVEGETLAERLARGPLPLKSALELAVRIAEALEAAHERGILHRDLKPSNVKLMPEGGVKVLDFGLAKALEGDGSSDEGIRSSVATLPQPAERTDRGLAVGTAPNMSPEQARGEAVGRRTDVWAFGCILFEMLTGRRAFSGATRADSIAAVLEREPEWGSLPAGTPEALRRILKRCLQKDRKRRLRDIADVRLELDELRSEKPSAAAIRPRRRWVFPAMAIAVLVVLVAFGSWFLRPRALPTAATQARFQLSLPRGVGLGMGAPTVLAISPDGKTAAFVGCGGGLGCLLYLRGPSEIDARPLQGTEGAECPFFSPDGRWIAFGAGGKVKKVDLEHGSVVAVADAPQMRGGSWGEDGTILFSRGRGGLLRVSADGGEVREVTKLDPGRKEYDHRWPQLLPGGRAALFEIMYEAALSSSGSRGHDVATVDLETGTKRVLVENAGCPKYVSGHLLFGRDGIIYAAPLDFEPLALIREPVPVLEGVAMWSSPGGGARGAGNVYYDVSKNGTLLFSPNEARLPRRTLVFVDREGRREAASSLQRTYTNTKFSPDGGRIAVAVQMEVDSSGTFVLDVASGAWTRVGGEGNLFPGAWMPDGKQLLLIGSGSEDLGLFLAPADGREAARMLLHGEFGSPAVAPDGSAVLFGRQAAPVQWDIWRLALTRDENIEPWLATASLEAEPRFSPDGQWVTYRSNKSGENEVYVRSYAGDGGIFQVSTRGGIEPRWSRDGKEIFFLSRGSLWSVFVRASPMFSSDPPRKLFDFSDDILLGFYDVSPDGQHFVMVEKDPFELRPLDLVIVPGWVDEMKARLAAAE